jgi:hypothetical protein
MHKLVTSGVVVALLGCVGSIVTTYLQGKTANDDMHDSYKVLAEAVNHLQKDVGRLEGRLDAAEGSRVAPMVSAPVMMSTPMLSPSEEPKKGAKKAPKKPAMSMDSVMLFVPVDAGPGEPEFDHIAEGPQMMALPELPVPAAPGASAPLPTDLGQALQQSRAAK